MQAIDCAVRKLKDSEDVVTLEEQKQRLWDQQLRLMLRMNRLGMALSS